ncbi:hypothetical protein CTAYLR_005270 [Chrysophaeum taylorii]|uniref:peptidylprolyl isomerase n=1 Tax=Chrysophaeum taylorii TaxID=2483200 RepID=A0AAD7XPP5_9STRA|nr:hypothetical protein CTAYLR_005270 [Chrysophaeum taylorii]
MIEPNRFGHCLVRPRYHEVEEAPSCARCRSLKNRIPDSTYEVREATVVAWGNRPFCEKCYDLYKRKHKLAERREPIVMAGEGVVKKTLAAGDGSHYPKPHDDVSILYEVFVIDENDESAKRLVDSSAIRGRPVVYRSGSSGPCLHAQILSGHRLHEGTGFDVPDVYAVGYWRNVRVGQTSERENTTNPVWECETLVFPLGFEERRTVRRLERAALKGCADEGSAATTRLLRIELYDANTFTKDEFLGQVTLTTKQVASVLRGSDGAPRVYPLRPKLASGRLRFSAARTTHATTGAVYVCLSIVGCENLASVDGASTISPYVVCFWRDAYVGQTPVKRTSDRPAWKDAVFNFAVTEGRKKGPPIPLAELAHKLGTVRLEVRDSHRFGWSVLGEIVVEKDDLIEMLRRSDEVTRTADPKLFLSGRMDRSCIQVFALSGTLRDRFRSCFGQRQQQQQQPGGATNVSIAKPRMLKRALFADAADRDLVLSDAHNCCKRVRGTLGLRLIYHTRGTVLRGIDVGVSQMSLGERARLKIRPDYGFDSASPAPLVPAFAKLEAVVDLVAIGDRTATWVFFHRAMHQRVRLVRHRLGELWRDIKGRYPKLAAFLEFVLSPVVFATLFSSDGRTIDPKQLTTGLERARSSELDYLLDRTYAN